VSIEQTGDGVDAIVVAAGASRRMGIDKLAVEIGGRALLSWTVEAIARAPIVERVVVVVPAERLDEMRTRLSPTATAVVAGGARRQESVAAGLAALERLDRDTGMPDRAGRIVLVHDGARPLVSVALVEAVVEAARRHGAAIPGLPVSDTIKRIDGSLVTGTIDRAELVAVQTPQAVRRDMLLDAFSRYPPAGPETWTDEAALLEACEIAVHVVPGEPENLKVTVPADLAVIARHFDRDLHRVGIGVDSHPFGPGEPLRLGGLEIDAAPRLHGHSDGDVVLHAIADAMLGAAGLPDLGRQFPADDATPTGVSSGTLLDAVTERVADAGWRPASVDVTITGARPRLGGYLDRMGDGLAVRLEIDRAAVSVKASTGNLGGDEGAGRSISALAIVALDRR
jgi:2-C-methyl-D-erythritol 4-phosphate cytidylyltransferase/2-C-methyl-D-erythritol 2,4-cyclodiphosphate synthase